MTHAKIILLLLVFSILLIFHQLADAQYSIQNSVFGNGGAVTENENYSIVGTVGQPGIGVTTNAANIISIGFWYIPSPLPPLKYGDVSGDGDVTAYDASLVLQYVVGLTDFETAQKQAADVTNDGSVTALDAALILQHTVGLITKFPAELTTTAAPALSAKSEEEALRKKIARLEGIKLNNEQKKVLEQLKLLLSKSIPKRTVLLQNYPNPFNPESWIPYQLANDAVVTISIYNVKGQLVRTLNLGTQKAGIYMTKNKAAHWDGKDAVGEAVSSGVYFYHLKAGDFFATRKMVILK